MYNNIYLKLNLDDEKDNKKDVSIYFLGNIYNNKLKKINLEEIYDLYIKYGERIYNYIDGVFSLVIKDVNDKIRMYKKSNLKMYKIVHAKLLLWQVMSVERKVKN